jgi:hypothetical protein
MAFMNMVIQEVRGRSRSLGDTCIARDKSETSSAGERKTMLMIISSGAAGAVGVVRATVGSEVGDLSERVGSSEVTLT